MKTAVKIAGIAFVLSAVGAGLTGCGGSDSDGGDSGNDASKSVTKDGFCEKFNELYDNLAGASSDDPTTAIKGVKDWAAEMEDYGTPSELSDDERDGFDVVISTFEGIDDDATAEDLQNLGDDVSAEDNKSAEAFGSWTTKNCPSPSVPSAPSDDAS
ncbi:hypothetical protein GCM10009795_027560 [Nocardioides hankookensis]|uniref:Lipoprotein n=1 Tax=Nocardioides hankookensis TaxID=443157 RepID=A0ABW1LDM4_9ACTN